MTRYVQKLGHVNLLCDNLGGGFSFRSLGAAVWSLFVASAPGGACMHVCGSICCCLLWYLIVGWRLGLICWFDSVVVFLQCYTRLCSLVGIWACVCCCLLLFVVVFSRWLEIRSDRLV